MLRTPMALIVALSLSTFAQAIEAPMPRHPAPSPDASTIVFSWQGDLWSVPASGGTAQRLTAHPAMESHPIWSRDGSTIAFASNRHGHNDVFVMPSDGSEQPKRLTFADRSDVPLDFSTDGSAVLFSSSRASSVRWMPGLWRVPVAGGTPVLEQDALGEHACFSPDGEALAFVRGATKWTRHGYRGPASRTPWLRNATGDYYQLSEFDGDEDHPCWINSHTLAILSSRSERKNIHLLNLVTGDTLQITQHDGTDVRAPRASANGRLVAYEFEDAIWTVDPISGSATRLQIQVPADSMLDQMVRKTVRDGATDLTVHPDGELTAFVVEGDVFIAEILSEDDQDIAKPRTTQITKTAEREADPRWSPDGTTLLFTSAQAGNNDLWIARLKDEDTGWIETFDFTLEPLVATEAEEGNGRWSPDGQHIAMIRGKGDLVVVDAAGGNLRLIHEHWSPADFDWSPDGKWLAYSTNNVHYNAEVWIVSANGGEAVNVSRHPDDDLQPRWSPDGRRLLWVSKRHRDTHDVWGVWLQKEDDERTASQWLKLFNDKGSKDDEKNADEVDAEKADEDEKEELPEVIIDFDDLWQRAERITGENGDESSPLASPDGKTIFFTAAPDGKDDLYSIRFDGGDLKRLTEGGEQPLNVQFDKDGGTLYFTNTKGNLKRIALDGKAGDPMPFAARATIDVEKRRAATFDEAWRALNEWFYDPDFHGVDWQSKADVYRPLADEARTERDFSDVLNLMLGELNASHMGYYPKRSTEPEGTGWLGVTFSPQAGGPGLVIDEVIKDGPGARVATGLATGDRLLTVGGREVTETSNIFELLVDSDGQRVPLKVLGPDGEERQTVVVPTDFGTQDQLRYETWVRQRRELTEQYSGGRLGYIHIQSMGMVSFEEFERSLQAAAEGKEGLLIDVRSNGGGWTTDLLMAVLMVKRHAYTVPRDDVSGIKAYPQSRLPLSAWTRPAATLCNEDSYSNAEIFSHAFKTLDRGKLIGTTTFGAVISTGGAVLPDGGRVRLPLRGWYVAGSGVNMEKQGAVPDVAVAQPPAEDTRHTSDTQLREAVDVLLADISTDPRAQAW